MKNLKFHSQERKEAALKWIQILETLKIKFETELELISTNQAFTPN